jgi:hypothetical protein
MVDRRLLVGIAEVFAGSAQWGTTAATFTDVVPPAVTGTWPSAVAVGAIHADVAASHAAFGARLLDTAGQTQVAGTAFAVQDVEQNVEALEDVIGGAVRS